MKLLHLVDGYIFYINCELYNFLKNLTECSKTIPHIHLIAELDYFSCTGTEDKSFLAGENTR